MDVISEPSGFVPCDMPTAPIEYVVAPNTGERRTRVRSQVYAYLLQLARQAENRADIPVLIILQTREECTND